MVDISNKMATKRTAKAQAIIRLSVEIVEKIKKDQPVSKKGPVLITAIIAGVQGAKKTSELIPFCHPLNLDNCQIQMSVLDDDRIAIECTATIEGKTGVEMEALTGATVAALTVYDMCKAMSHEITIEEVCLLEKAGGKKDYTRKSP